MFRNLLLSFALGVSVAGCAGSTAAPSAPASSALATPTPTPTPAPQHLYVGSVTVSQFTLPLTSTSQPNFKMSNTELNVSALGLDASGNLAIGNTSGEIQFFNAPIAAASTASATFQNGGTALVGQIAFTAAGNMFATNSNSAVNIFTPPFSNNSVPSASSIANAPIANASGAVFDAAGNLYVTDSSNIVVFAPPYTGAPIASTPPIFPRQYFGEAINAAQLFVAAASGVDVYALPVTSTSAPQFTIISGVSGASSVAIDGFGQLYVLNTTNGSIAVYAPPFSATSVPATVTPFSAADLKAIVIGK